MEKSAESGFGVLSAEGLYMEGAEDVAVGIGVQILPCSGDEDCYGSDGCSIMIALDEIPEDISVDDVVSHPEEFEVIIIQSCLCTKHALQRRR